MQTNRRPVGGWEEEGWFVDPVNRPSNRAMLERRLASGNPGLMYASDGPYTEAHLRERIVGTVVGVLVPQRAANSAIAIDIAPDQARPVIDGDADPLAHVHPIDRAHEQTNTVAAAKALTAAVSPALRAAIVAHRDAFTTSHHERDNSDANMARHYAVIDRAADAIDAVPSNTLADLRAKLTYLLPRVLPDVNGRDHVARLLAISDDLDRMCRADGRPNLSKVPAAELAAMPFDPVDRSTTPCPVPSREAWIKDADMALPWLRMGWLYLSLNRDELADAMLAEDEQQADDFNHSLQVAARNFDQLARFARTVLDRRMIGIATLAVREGAPDDLEGA